MSVSPPGSDPPSPDGTVQSAVRAVAKFQAEMHASHHRQPAHSRAQGTPLRPAEPAERALHFDGAVKPMSGITSRQPAIPVLDHSPAMPIAQPAKSHLAARAASPLKPRTARIPMNPGSELATLPTLLDLQVDLRCMSRGALTARRDILEAELARVHTALADLDRLHAMQDAARTVAEQAAYSHSMATPAPGTAAVTARAAAVEGNVNSNSRSRGRSASGASAGWAPADSNGASQPQPGATSTPLSAQLRSIALRVITPPRTRPGASAGTSRAAATVPHSTAGDLSDYRAHPASHAPSPNGATQQALEDMFWASPPQHRITAAGAATAIVHLGAVLRLRRAVHRLQLAVHSAAPASTRHLPRCQCCASSRTCSDRGGREVYCNGVRLPDACEGPQLDSSGRGGGCPRGARRPGLHVPGAPQLPAG
jgi:hypothetical protein